MRPNAGASAGRNVIGGDAILSTPDTLLLMRIASCKGYCLGEVVAGEVVAGEVVAGEVVTREVVALEGLVVKAGLIWAERG